MEALMAAEAAMEAPAPVGSVGVRHVESARFGAFDIPEDRIFELPRGLVGFPEAQSFALLDHRPGSPFKWMLSIDDPELAFVVADPAELVPGYVPPIATAATVLGCEPGSVVLFVLVTIHPDPTSFTVNLLAPVVVDHETRRGVQVILEDPRLETAYQVVRPRPSAEASK